MSYGISRFIFIFVCCLSSSAEAKVSEKQEARLIVLFHGLANHATSFNSIKKAMLDAFPAASVIAATSVEGMKSVNLSIKEQAEQTFQELVGQIASLENRPILLIGHSQGGLRAYSFFKQFHSTLQIKGLITLAAPWEGAPGARVDLSMLADHLTDSMRADLSRLSHSLGYPKAALEAQLKLQVQANQSVCLLPGGKDLMEGSPFLEEVQKSLVNERLSILAIGGGQSDFRALLTQKSRHDFKALNHTYTFLVAGEGHTNGAHDMQVPLYSQHATNILPIKKKTFQRLFIKDAFHSGHVLSIPVPKSKNILEHPRALQAIIKFAKHILR